MPFISLFPTILNARSDNEIFFALDYSKFVVSDSIWYILLGVLSFCVPLCAMQLYALYGNTGSD